MSDLSRVLIELFRMALAGIDILYKDGDTQGRGPVWSAVTALIPSTARPTSERVPQKPVLFIIPKCLRGLTRERKCTGNCC